MIHGTLRPDLVLVALPPLDERFVRGVVRLAKPRELFPRMGMVLQVGASVADVRPLDWVVFEAEAAEEVDGLRWPCVLVPEMAVEAVVECE